MGAYAPGTYAQYFVGNSVSVGGNDYNLNFNGSQDVAYQSIYTNPNVVGATSSYVGDNSSGGGINWTQVGDGALTAVGGIVSTVGGVMAIGSGVGTPVGVAGVTFGIPTIGFGVANVITGFQGGEKLLPGGPLEATDIGLGGSGTIGQIGDIFSGGIEKDVFNGVMMGYGIYTSNIGQAMFYSPANIGNMSSSYIMPRDNTYVSPKIH